MSATQYQSGVGGLITTPWTRTEGPYAVPEKYSSDRKNYTLPQRGSSALRDVLWRNLGKSKPDKKEHLGLRHDVL